jgi:hypothetical protein
MRLLVVGLKCIQVKRACCERPDLGLVCRCGGHRLKLAASAVSSSGLLVDQGPSELFIRFRLKVFLHFY